MVERSTDKINSRCFVLRIKPLGFNGTRPLWISTTTIIILWAECAAVKRTNKSQFYTKQIPKPMGAAALESTFQEYFRCPIGLRIGNVHAVRQHLISGEVVRCTKIISIETGACINPVSGFFCRYIIEIVPIRHRRASFAKIPEQPAIGAVHGAAVMMGQVTQRGDVSSTLRQHGGQF